MTEEAPSRNAVLPLVCFRASRATLERYLGTPQSRNADSNGMGPMDGWRLTFPCGLELFVWLFLIHPNGAPIENEDLAYVEVHSTTRDEQHVAFHLPVPTTERWHWEPGAAESSPLQWVVLRQDESGNREEVGRYSSRCEAESVAQSYEARGHKQLYWVDRIA